MAATDSRFHMDSRFEGDSNAGNSSNDELEDGTSADLSQDGLEEGMDPEGFAGPSKVVKPLTPEALAAFKAAQEKAGVIYISRIPPGMRPTKVRHIMSAYGEVGRVYLQQEGTFATPALIPSTLIEP